MRQKQQAEVVYVTPAPLGNQGNGGYDIPTFPGFEPTPFYDVHLGPGIPGSAQATTPGVFVDHASLPFGVGVLTGQLNSYPILQGTYPTDTNTPAGVAAAINFTDLTESPNE